jgi:hypothetical protein
MWQSHVQNCFYLKMKTNLNVVFHWNTYQSGNKGRNIKKQRRGKTIGKKLFHLEFQLAFFTTDLLEEQSHNQTLCLIGIVRRIFTQSVCCMNDETGCCIIGYIVRYMIPKLHFPSFSTWNGKGKAYSMTYLSRHRRKEEVYFQLIHNRAIKDGEWSAPAGLPPWKIRCQFCIIVREFWGRSGWTRKIWLLLGFDPQTVTNFYTSYVIRVTIWTFTLEKFLGIVFKTNLKAFISHY